MPPEELRSPGSMSADLTGGPVASVLFVCVRNSGKSQMAAGLLGRLVGDGIVITSAGTHAGQQLNALSVQTLAEVGVDIADQHPRQITDDLQRGVDLVVVVGDAVVPVLPGCHYRYWATDEPSRRGIEGIERMRLVRDDIDQHVHRLADELGRSARALLDHPSRELRP